MGRVCCREESEGVVCTYLAIVVCIYLVVGRRANSKNDSEVPGSKLGKVSALPVQYQMPIHPWRRRATEDGPAGGPGVSGDHAAQCWSLSGRLGLRKALRVEYSPAQ